MKLKFGCFTRIMFIASPNEYLLNVSKIEISLSRFSEPRLLDKKLTKDVKLDDTASDTEPQVQAAPFYYL